jgi:hypothetical protein
MDNHVSILVGSDATRSGVTKNKPAQNGLTFLQAHALKSPYVLRSVEVVCIGTCHRLESGSPDFSWYMVPKPKKCTK